MIWLAWRQIRVSAVSVYAALAAIGVVLAITGPDLVDRTDFSDQEILYRGGMIAVYLLPAVLGIFWGVPMITRELETGTHHLVWNQTITRDRWLATKLGIGVLVAMVAAGLLSLAVSWWASPIDTVANTDSDVVFPQRLFPMVFAARGVAPIGYAAFALVLGVTVGILMRRTVTAMAVTLAVFAAVQVAVPLLVRPYLLPATEQTVALTTENIEGIRVESGPDGAVPESLSVAYPTGAWLLTNETLDPHGNAVALPAAVRGCLPPPSETDRLPDFEGVHECFAQRLSDLGYHQHLAYQPASRFWPLQWLETAFFLALSALLTWFCFRRLRHLS
jgi:ABC-type transport system involved in multi-copper enzyme maturation permease subunit